MELHHQQKEVLQQAKLQVMVPLQLQPHQRHLLHLNFKNTSHQTVLKFHSLNHLNLLTHQPHHRLLNKRHQHQRLSPLLRLLQPKKHLLQLQMKLQPLKLLQKRRLKPLQKPQLKLRTTNDTSETTV